MRDALISGRREKGRLLNCLTAVERGDFERAEAIVPGAGHLYLESLAWANAAAESLFEEAPAAAA